MLQEERRQRAVEIGWYIIKNNTTIRQAAKAFGISKSTVHKDVTYRLKRTDMSLYNQVRQVICYNISQRAFRGGQATKLKYMHKK